MRDTIDGIYWLHLEVAGSSTLVDVDTYLRAIWVDCCGHMSHFVFGTTRYQELIDGFFALGDQKNITTKASEVLRTGLKGRYEYDFGTPTELKIEVVGEREGKPLTTKPLTLLARNVMPAYACVPSAANRRRRTSVCSAISSRASRAAYLCAAHAKNHGCTLYGGPKKRFNSPRTGRCKYNGPAKPPY